MKFPRLFKLFALGALVLALAACAAPAATPVPPTSAPAPTNAPAPTTAPAASKKTIAFSPLALAIPALKGLSEGVKAVGGQMGYDVIVLDPNFDAPKQAQQLNELISSGRINAAWVISVNPGSMKPVVDLAQQKNVVLVLNGVPADYGYSEIPAGVTFARINYEKFGGVGGELLAECVNQKLGGKAKVLFLQSAEGTAGKQEIEGTMAAKLKELAPGAEIVATAIIKERAEAQNTVSQLLQKNPDANAVMTTNDEGGLGALGAFKAAGKAIPCLVDLGGNAEVLAAVKSGEMYGASVLEFEKDMLQTFDAFAAMMQNPSAPGKQLEVPVTPYKSQ